MGLHNVAQMLLDFVTSEVRVSDPRGPSKGQVEEKCRWVGFPWLALFGGNYLELHILCAQKLMTWYPFALKFWYTQSLGTIRSNATAVMSGLIHKLSKESRFMQTGFSVIPSKWVVRNGGYSTLQATRWCCSMREDESVMRMKTALRVNIWQRMKISPGVPRDLWLQEISHMCGLSNLSHSNW